MHKESEKPEVPLIEEFCSFIRYEQNRAALTVEAYERDLLQFCDWLTNGDSLSVNLLEVTSSDIRAWLAANARRGDSPRTVRRKIQSLRAFYRWLLKTGKINQSPAKEIALPKLSKPLPDLIKNEEIEEALILLKESEKGEDPAGIQRYLVVDMFYSLGIRRAELVSIDDSMISLSQKEIKITGKRSKQRVIPVPDELLDKIKSWQHIRDLEFPDLESPKPLFVVKGKRMTPQQVYTVVNRALSQSSAKKKSPHALRHSFASAMLNGGAEIDSVKEFLGHASLATTQIYTHISLAEIKKAYSSAHPRMDKKK